MRKSPFFCSFFLELVAKKYGSGSKKSRKALQQTPSLLQRLPTFFHSSPFWAGISPFNLSEKALLFSGCSYFLCENIVLRHRISGVHKCRTVENHRSLSGAKQPSARKSRRLNAKSTILKGRLPMPSAFGLRDEGQLKKKQ